MLTQVEFPKDQIFQKLIKLSKEVASRKVTADELEEAKSGVRHLVKFDTTELPRITQLIDGLEQFVLKSLKNQLNEDNKKSQGMISSMKKCYETLQKKVEALSVQQGDCRLLLQKFQDNFDFEDLERTNEIALIEERLEEEEHFIYGNS